MPVSLRLSGSQADELHQAFGLLQAGRADEALAIARRLAGRSADSADAQQLLGMCLARTGRSEAALQAFARALALAPDHPLILSNYALALRQSGRPWAALPLARRACEVSPSSAKARLELAVTAQAAGDHTLARSAAAQTLRLQPDSAAALLVAGNAARAAEDLVEAENAYQRILQREPQHRQAWLGLGDVRRRAGRAEQAFATYQQARNQAGAASELDDATVGALIDAGRVDEALQLAKATVRRFPGYVPGWTTLANLAWEYAAQPEGEACLGEFKAAATARNNPALRLAYARFLQSTGRAEEALSQLQVLRAAHDAPVLMLAEAQAHDTLGQTSRASALYAHLQSAGWESEPAFLNARARHLLRTGDGEGAAASAQAATRIDPTNQEAWANLAIAWRVFGDERETWLCDYERLVGLVDIEPPPQFADTAAFLQALSDKLDAMHQARREPMQQSLRGGSQTPGRLFGRADPLLEATRQSLLRGVERWLATLPDDPAHPFLSRKQRSVRIGGSWSVKLWSSGRHANHIHPEGWMSSAFYVSLPPSVRAGSRDSTMPPDLFPPGAIQFGQPPVELGLDLPPRRVVAPQPCLVALFPSYMWHGTIPFHDETPRMTIAFDMTPLGARR